MCVRECVCVSECVCVYMCVCVFVLCTEIVHESDFYITVVTGVIFLDILLSTFLAILVLACKPVLKGNTDHLQ